MAVNRSKDQPPAYQESKAPAAIDKAESSTSTSLKPNHSTRASMLSHAASRGEHTTLEYLELTFSVMIHYRLTSEVVVLAIHEDYDTLLEDLRRLFNTTQIRGMSALWEPGRPTSSRFKSDNTIAMLRLLNSRNGVDIILAQDG